MLKHFSYKKKRGLALLTCLTLCLSLTACGGKSQTGEKEEVKTETAASVSNGDLADDSHVIAVGNTTVTNQEYKAYYYFMKSQYENLLTSDIWSHSVKLEGADKTIGQEAIEDVVRLIIQIKVICKAAQGQGVSLAADEKEQADYNATNYLSKISQEDQKANALNATVLSRIFEENKLAEKMYNVVEGQTKIELSDQDIQAAKVQLLQLNYNASNKEEIRKKATDLLNQINTGELSFFPVAKANTDGDEVEQIIGKKDARTKLAEQALTLKQGQTSGLIEEADAFYLVHILKTPGEKINKAYKNQLVDQMQIDAFQNAYNNWAKSYEVRVSKSLLG